MARQPIREAQGYLRLIATRYPAITELKRDGIYGPLTAQAVREFQKIFSLPVTGIIDFDTWNAIYEVFLPIYQKRRPANNLGPPFPLAEGTIRRGDRGLPVEQLHAYFNQLSRHFRNINTVEESNFFGETTRRNVLELQRVGELAQTGEVDAITWSTLLGISGMFE